MSARLGRRRLLSGSAAAAALAALPRGASARSASTSARSDAALDEAVDPVIAWARTFTGFYVYAGGPDEDAQRRDSVDAALCHVPIFFRTLASHKLNQAAVIPPTVGIQLWDRVLTMTAHGSSYSAPVDGRPAPAVSLTGHDVELSYDIEESSLSQILVTEQRGQITRYYSDGDSLYAHVRIFAEVLPVEVGYLLTFERLPSV